MFLLTGTQGIPALSLTRVLAIDFFFYDPFEKDVCSRTTPDVSSVVCLLIEGKFLHL